MPFILKSCYTIEAIDSSMNEHTYINKCTIQHVHHNWCRAASGNTHLDLVQDHQWTVDASHGTVC